MIAIVYYIKLMIRSESTIPAPGLYFLYSSQHFLSTRVCPGITLLESFYKSLGFILGALERLEKDVDVHTLSFQVLVVEGKPKIYE